MRVNANLTLYNHYIHPTTHVAVYQRTQLTGVHWENRRAVNKIASGGDIAADKVLVLIPFSVDTGFLDPAAWQALADKSGNWTLAAEDYIVKGLVSDEITSGFTISDLKAKYDDVLKIVSVDTYDMGSARMQHWEVGAS